MSRIEVEFWAGSAEKPAWRRVSVQLKTSMRNNAFFKCGGEVYVLPDGLKTGSPVLRKEGPLWVVVGRVLWGKVPAVFVGPKDALSYGEYAEKMFREDLAAGKYPLLQVEEVRRSE